jgi:hypothetical protein
MHECEEGAWKGDKEEEEEEEEEEEGEDVKSAGQVVCAYYKGKRAEYK